MIPYINVLDNPNNITLDLVEKYAYKDIDIKYLPFDLSIKCAYLIKKIDELNPLKLKKEEYDMEFTNYIVDEEDLRQYRLGEYDLYYCLKRGLKSFNDLGINKNGFNKMMELLIDYIKSYRDKEIDIDSLKLSIGDLVNRQKCIEKGYSSVRELILDCNNKSLDNDLADYLVYIEEFFNIRKDYLFSKNKVKEYIDLSSKILKMQKRLPKELEKEVSVCIKDIENLKIELPNHERMIKYKLSNAFFITPYNHLYNVSTHKFASIYKDYNMLIKSSDNSYLEYNYHLDKYKSFKENGYFTRADFWFYFNLIYNSFFIKDDTYMNMDKATKFMYERGTAKCYNRTILELILGIESAKTSIYKFFYDLKNNSNNYEEEIAKISKMDFPDFLVRCCGFHKVESQVNKTITTSLINYEDAFSEYINRGWKIEFIPPIVLNNGVLEEYNKDFLTIRKMLKMGK